MTAISIPSKAPTRILLISASALALSVPASANDVLFSTSGAQVEAGQRMTQSAGLTQIKLTSGATISITQGTEYTLNDDGSIDLHKGSITVAGGPRSSVEVNLPGGTLAKLYGSNSSASFSVADDGTASGHTLTGTMRVRPQSGRSKTFKAGDMWGAKAGETPSRTIANAPQTQPGAAPREVVAISGDAGPVNAAFNGIPVTLGDGLAGLGASSDIAAAGRAVEIAIENPTIERFPSGDLALLVATAAQLEGVYGGTPFEAAQADIIRSYLGFLASGSSGADFLTAYSGFALQYLDLIRAGGVPSGFESGVVGAADIDAYLAFIERSGALANLAAQDRSLVDAYLRFLSSGQDRDLFASSLAELTQNYLDFLRAGGAPTEFTGASQEALADAIAFLQQTGLLQGLSASDQAFINAFVANGGAEFAAVFQQALADYFAFIASGQLPSDFASLDQATLQAYLETLSDTGLLDRLPAEQAQFYADYLAFLRAGGDVDGFVGLPIYLDYVAALNAYFAFLEAGNLPSEYTELDLAILEQYLEALAALQGGLAGFGDLNQFFIDYLEFIRAGNDPDQFAGLPANMGGGTGGGGNGGGTGGNTGGTGTFADFVPGDTVTAFVKGAQRAGRTAINNPMVSDDGALSGDFFNAGTATITDVGGDERGIVGAYRDGSFSFDNGQTFREIGPNQALHYVGLQPIVGDLPQMGTIDYQIIAATAPTYEDGSTAPGTFDANLTVGFGSSLTYGIDGTITMPDATYTFASPGRESGALAAPQVASADFFVLRPDLTGPGSACSAGQRCQLNMFGAFSGTNPQERVGFAYETLNLDIFDAPSVTGAVLFGAEGTFSTDTGSGSGTGGGGTGGGTGNSGGSSFTGTRDNQVYYTYINGSLASGFGGSADFVDGEVTNFTSILGTVSSNDAEIVEATDLEEVAWARWTNGTVETRGVLGDIDSVIDPNGGYHVMTGSVTTSLPAGTIAYELIGGTSATDNAGSSPGTLTGDLAIAFGSVSRVGYDLNMAVGGRSWAVSTQGGASDPASSEVNLVSGSAGFTFGGTFTSTTGTVTSTGDACAVSCLVSIGGTLYGDNAAYAALAMNVTDSGATSVIGASGIAIFGQEGASNAASIKAPSNAATDWSRWEVATSASSDAPASMAPATMPSLEAVTARALTDRAGAIAEAEAMLGGMISWGGAKH